MIRDARYVHTNLIARDWRRLAEFYAGAFGCEAVPPERNFSGPELEAGTGVTGAALAGVHLRLPGFGGGGDGPTLEIFTYSRLAPGEAPCVNRPGFGHVAFSVASVPEAQAEVIRLGGRPLGEVVELVLSDGRRVTWCYVHDPEGNLIELQSWSEPAKAGGDQAK